MARIVVVAPGRGSYNRSELDYLRRFADHPNAAKRRELLAEGDRLRAALGRPTISELDQAAAYSTRVHLPGENASALIFTASAADFLTLSESHQVVAVLGNSMGWYTTLFLGGALSFSNAFKVVDTMGWQQQDRIIGGQVIYPVVGDDWLPSPERAADAAAALARVNADGSHNWVGLSIRLGGFAVFAGTDSGVKALLAELPKLKLGENEYPFQLARHSAFHTQLMAEAAALGRERLADLPWQQPLRPMIDGRGAVWRPGQTDATALRDYTLGHQVVEPYDFSASVRVALREYNPDHVVLLGPGETLGGSIAQVMIAEGWHGLRSKADFVDAQKGERPPLIAVNRADQAALVI